MISETKENNRLELVPISLKEANEFVKTHHRHHQPVVGHKFSIAASANNEIVGVVIVGRPVSRVIDDGFTLEVTRCCTNGYKNAPSMLYRAAWRAVSSMGYRKLITYTLPEESRSSLLGAGLRLVGISRGGSWSRPSRPRVDTHPLQSKLKWEIQI
jgi:hypothetical protein